MLIKIIIRVINSTKSNLKSFNFLASLLWNFQKKLNILDSKISWKLGLSQFMGKFFDVLPVRKDIGKIFATWILSSDQWTSKSIFRYYAISDFTYRPNTVIGTGSLMLYTFLCLSNLLAIVTELDMSPSICSLYYI